MNDFEQIFETALARNGLIYTFESTAAATTFRFTCHRWRKKHDKDGRYEVVKIRAEGPKLTFNVVKVNLLGGSLTDLEGTPITELESPPSALPLGDFSLD